MKTSLMIIAGVCCFTCAALGGDELVTNGGFEEWSDGDPALEAVLASED